MSKYQIFLFLQYLKRVRKVEGVREAKRKVLMCGSVHCPAYIAPVFRHQPKQSRCVKLDQEATTGRVGQDRVEGVCLCEDVWV